MGLTPIPSRSGLIYLTPSLYGTLLLVNFVLAILTILSPSEPIKCSKEAVCQLRPCFMAIINTRQTYNTRHKHLRYSLRDCHNNPPHQLVSSYMQVVTCTMGITLDYVFLVKHASGHKTREQLRYVSKVQTLFMLNYCCCRNVLKSSPPLSHYY